MMVAAMQERETPPPVPTQCQEPVLVFIAEYQATHLNRPPTVGEIARAVRKSRSTVHGHLNRLRAAGLVLESMSRTHRSCYIASAGVAWLNARKRSGSKGEFSANVART